MARKYLENFEKLKEEIAEKIKNQPWKVEILDRIQSLVTKYVSVWLTLASQIEEDKAYHEENIEKLFQIFDSAFENVISDINKLHEKHTTLVENYTKKLHEVESQLGIPELADINKACKEQSLRKAEELLKDTIKMLKSELAKKREVLKKLEEKHPLLMEKLNNWQRQRETLSLSNSIITSID